MMNPITKELEWNCSSTLPSIPDFTPLAMTHASIRSRSNTNNDDITRRLCECFAKRSHVTEELNAEDARAVVRCTKDVHTTKIGVQLYQKNDGKTIVEVVRLSGDMLLFRRESQAILSAARGDDKLALKKKKCNPYMTSTKRPVLSRPAPVKKRSRSGGTNTSVNTSQEDQDVHMHMHMHMAIEKTDELIKKDRMDARIIGWASLCALTDSSHSCTVTDTAVHASKIVLGLDDEMATDIHMNVFDILSSRGDTTEVQVHASQKTSIEIELALRIRRLAFQALQNALHTLYLSGNRLLQAQDYLKNTHDLMMLLVEEMKCADVSPCEASMAAACLKVLFLLLQQDDRHRERMIQSGAIAQEVLIQAKYTGGCSYADLAIASERALTALNARNNDVDVNDVADVASQ